MGLEASFINWHDFIPFYVVLKSGKHKTLYILLSIFITIIVGIGSFVMWVGANYKRIIIERLPAMMTKSTDSIYHATIKDISINLFKHSITLSGVKLWADTIQVNTLRLQGRYSPNTVSFIDIPQAEIYGINWGDILV